MVVHLRVVRIAAVAAFVSVVPLEFSAAVDGVGEGCAGICYPCEMARCQNVESGYGMSCIVNGIRIQCHIRTDAELSEYGGTCSDADVGQTQRVGKEMTILSQAAAKLI